MKNMSRIQSDREHLLDLLVDGELTDAARGELLRWCEEDPQGWRRCALAFLEGQSWSEGAKNFAARPNPGAGGTSPSWHGAEVPRHDEDAAGGAKLTPASKLAPAIEAQSRVSGGARRWRSILGPAAMAASFLLTFGLGLLARSGWPRGGSTEPTAGSATMVVKQDPAESPNLDPWREPSRRGPSRGPLGQVRLVVGGPNGSADEIELPVVEGEALDPEFFRNRPAAVPLEVERALERMGHRVQQRRDLVPLRLEDGRRLIVPVDQVEVHRVGNHDYQ